MKKRRAQKPVAAQSAPERVWGRIWHYFLVVLIGLMLAVGVWGRGTNAQIELGSGLVMLDALLVSELVGAGLMMCYVVARISQRRTTGALAGICYMAMPYCLGAVYARGAANELLGLMIVPLLLLGLYQLTAQQAHATRTLAVTFALLLLTQSELAIVLGVAAGIYILLALPKLCHWETWWRLMLAVVVMLGLLAFGLAPIMETWWLNGHGSLAVSYLGGLAGAEGASWNGQTMNLAELLLGNGVGTTVGVAALLALVGFWCARTKIEDRTERYFVTVLYLVGVAAILALLLIDWGGLAAAGWKLDLSRQCLAVMSLVLSVVAAYTAQALLGDEETVRQRVAVALAGVGLVSVNANAILAERGYADIGQMSWGERQMQSLLTVNNASMGTKIGLGVTAATVGLGLIWLIFDYFRGLRRAKENAEAEIVMNSVKAAVESAKQAAERELKMEDAMLAMPTEPVKPKRGRPRKTEEPVQAETKTKAMSEVAEQAAVVKAKAKKAKSATKSSGKGGKK